MSSAAEAIGSLSLSQLRHRVYTSVDSAPDQVTVLAQTSDGFLWLGSPTGLARFDGAAFDASFGRLLPSPNVHALFSDGEDLWIGYAYGGVSRLRGGQIANYDAASIPIGGIDSFARSLDGVLWVAGSKGLAKLVGGRWLRVGAEIGLPDQNIIWMAQTDGTLWVMGNRGAYALAPGANRFIPMDRDRLYRARMHVPASVVRQFKLPSLSNRSMLIDGAGDLWMRGEKGVTRYRWSRTSDQVVVENMTSAQGLSSDSVPALLQDREGNMWLGTARGLDEFSAPRFTRLDLPGRFEVPSFALAADGSLWAGSLWQGVLRVNQGRVSTTRLGKDVWCILVDNHGGIWAGGDDKLRYWLDGKLSQIPLPPALATLSANDISGLFQAMAVDRQGGLWLSVAKYDLYYLAHGRWTLRGGLGQLPTMPPIRLLADDAGRMWFTYPDNRIAVLDHGKLQVYTKANGLAVGNVQAIHVRGAQVWVGGDLGVAHLEHGRFATLRGVHGDTFGGTAGLVETAAGELWIDGAAGVYRISAAEVTRVRADPTRPVGFELFNQQDGLAGPALQIRPGPTMQLGRDGRLWVARFGGISWIDPEHVRRNRIAPVVSIQSLHAAGVAYPLAAGLVLPKLTRSLHFDYTAPSLSMPQRVRFRYQLEGVDAGWQDAGMRRQAFYTNLGPGSYRFRVRAANADGVESAYDATFDFRIAPAFYQTWWFGVLCGCLVLGTLWLLYLLRLRQLAVHDRIRGTERERIARDLHDTLLQGIQGLQLHLQTWAGDMSLAPHRRDEMGRVAMRTRDMLIDGRDRIIALRRSGVPDGGLVAALRASGEDYASMYPACFALHEDGEPRMLRPEAANEALDIMREGLRNAFVHAAAGCIELAVVWQNGGLCLRVSDDGRGIDEAVLRTGGRAGHWGLPGMRERAARVGAQFDLYQREGGGTMLSLWLPARGTFADTRARLLRGLQRAWKVPAE